MITKCIVHNTEMKLIKSDKSKIIYKCLICGAIKIVDR